ncbi:MAG: bifunctional (p)ppGpp synthetase/guanosine-3',5'-bis(diphosphate) 3'-pyrophosphohydrolase [Pseudomonadota bacterium]
MMRQYELVERVASYTSSPDEALLNKAYVYAMQKHGQQKRASGDPYFSHPLEVAAILTDLHLDEETIAVALLHDTIEDTDATRREIDEIFGEKIGFLVEGLTKLKRLDFISKRAKQAENLRRLLLAISNDVRVLLVKLADRLHNMRTLDHMREDKRVRIATETMEIYAPLAGRMGMQDLRDELEVLSFKHINPVAYEAVTKHLMDLAEVNQSLIAEISRMLQERLNDQNIKAEIKSRQKKPYSVFRKMESKALGFEQLSDVYGFRIIVDTIEDCYRALGIVHTDWRMVPGRFKDFISVPKQNDYQSIHTTIVGPSRQRVELQIRTRRMHEVAEYGIAAHATYKDGEDALSESNAYATLRKTIEQLAEGDNPEEFLEHTKLELFLDQVFCFTPKGQIIALPKGGTPIDFAYAVHTDIGNSCIGCKLNGKIMPVITELQNGDEVEIMRSKSQTPPAAWESVVVTGKARSSIRRASRQAIHKQYCALGTRIIERHFGEQNSDFNIERLQVILPILARNSVNDVLADVGRGEMRPEVILAAYNQADNDTSNAIDPDELLGTVRKKNANGKGASGTDETRIPIRGISDELPVRFSKTGAVPGDRIIGILEPGQGITIYQADSKELSNLNGEKNRFIDVRWDVDEARNRRFPGRISILGANAPGTLATITEIIAKNDCNIQNLEMRIPVSDFAEFEIDIEVWDLPHLKQLIRELADTSVVTNIKRMVD